ncbi:MAG: hypothetical protein ACP5I5_00095 [Thermosulfidibacteraceae bacterium]
MNILLIGNIISLLFTATNIIRTLTSETNSSCNSVQLSFLDILFSKLKGGQCSQCSLDNGTQDSTSGGENFSTTSIDSSINSKLELDKDRSVGLDSKLDSLLESQVFGGYLGFFDFGRMDNLKPDNKNVSVEFDNKTGNSNFKDRDLNEDEVDLTVVKLVVNEFLKVYGKVYSNGDSKEFVSSLDKNDFQPTDFILSNMERNSEKTIFKTDPNVNNRLDKRDSLDRILKEIVDNLKMLEGKKKNNDGSSLDETLESTVTSARDSVIEGKDIESFSRLNSFSEKELDASSFIKLDPSSKLDFPKEEILEGTNSDNLEMVVYSSKTSDKDELSNLLVNIRKSSDDKVESNNTKESITHSDFSDKTAIKAEFKGERKLEIPDFKLEKVLQNVSKFKIGTERDFTNPKVIDMNSFEEKVYNTQRDSNSKVFSSFIKIDNDSSGKDYFNHITVDLRSSVNLEDLTVETYRKIASRYSEKGDSESNIGNTRGLEESFRLNNRSVEIERKMVDRQDLLNRDSLPSTSSSSVDDKRSSRNITSRFSSDSVSRTSDLEVVHRSKLGSEDLKIVTLNIDDLPIEKVKLQFNASTRDLRVIFVDRSKDCSNNYYSSLDFVDLKRNLESIGFKNVDIYTMSYNHSNPNFSNSNGHQRSNPSRKTTYRVEVGDIQIADETTEKKSIELSEGSLNKLA